MAAELRQSIHGDIQSKHHAISKGYILISNHGAEQSLMRFLPRIPDQQKKNPWHVKLGALVTP